VTYEVRLANRLEKTYEQLSLEIKAGNGANEREYKLIKKAINQLSYNYKTGLKLGRSLPIFKYCAGKYGVNNVWKLNISKSWRILYTLVDDEIEIFSIILELVDHKTYDRIGGYHTS